MTHPVRLISAVDACGALGYNNAMAWHSPEEFKHFKSSTMGGVMIMGRATYDSIGKPLPGRETLVVSRHPHPMGIPSTLSSSLVECLAYAQCTWPDKPIWICGGAQIYAQAIEQMLVDEIVLSRMNLQVEEADVYFPALNDRWMEDGRRRQEVYSNDQQLLFTVYHYIHRST